MYRKLKIGQTDRCHCNTSHHLLTDCPLHDAVRLEIWLKDISLRDKLHGDLAALQRTAALAGMTGVSI